VELIVVIAVTAIVIYRAIPMLHLFVAPAPFEGWGEHPYNGTNLSQMPAGLLVIICVGALTLAVCRVLVMLLAG